MSAGVNGLYREEGQVWLRVSPGHSISEQWLEERAPDLYARWWDAPSLPAREEVARSIEDRLEELESAESWEKMALRHRAATPLSPLADRVARYEAEAAQLGATGFVDPRRTAAQLSHQASGDALRAELSTESGHASAVYPGLAPTLIAQPEWLSELGWRAREEPVRAGVDSDFGFGWGLAQRTCVSFMAASRDPGGVTTDPGTRGVLYLYDGSSDRYAVVARNVTYAGVLAAEAEHTGFVRGQDPVEFAHRVVHHSVQHSVGEPAEAGSAAELDRADRALLLRRVEAADLVADRPFIEALTGVSVDRLAVAALRAAAQDQSVVVAAERIHAEMAAEAPHAALRADVLLAVAAAGHDPAELRAAEAAGRGVDLAEVAPALLPASDFYARHAPAIEPRLDHEIARGGFADLPSYIASWHRGRPASRSLHDTEQAIVQHIVGGLIGEADADGRDLRDAQRMWQRAADRAALREWSGALERGDVELAAPRAAAEQRLDLGLHVDDEVDAGHDAEQEVG